MRGLVVWPFLSLVVVVRHWDVVVIANLFLTFSVFYVCVYARLFKCKVMILKRKIETFQIDDLLTTKKRER